MSRKIIKRNKKYKPKMLSKNRVVSQEFNIDDFFNDNIMKELDTLDDKIFNLKPEDDYEIEKYKFIRYVWRFFYINTGMIKPNLKIRYSYCQIAMNIRLLFETSIDVYYISRHLDNMDRIVGRLNNINDKRLDNVDYSHRDYSRDSSEFVLYDANGKATRTIKRIEYACEFNNYDLIDFYGELCAASHFNYLNIVTDINKSIDKDYLQGTFYLLTFYPMCLENIIRSIGEILGDKELQGFGSRLMTESINHKYELIKNGLDVKYSS